MIKTPFSKFSYMGYRKNPKNLFNSVTMASYPKQITVNLISIASVLFPKSYKNNVKVRVSILTALSNLNSTILLILNILFIINDKNIKSFLTINFNHIHSNCLPEQEDYWII